MTESNYGSNVNYYGVFSDNIIGTDVLGTIIGFFEVQQRSIILTF